MNILRFFFFFFFFYKTEKEEKKERKRKLIFFYFCFFVLAGHYNVFCRFFSSFQKSLILSFYSIFFSLYFISRTSNSRRCRRYHHRKYSYCRRATRKISCCFYSYCLVLPCIASVPNRTTLLSLSLFRSFSLIRKHTHTHINAPCLSTSERHYIEI